MSRRNPDRVNKINAYEQHQSPRRHNNRQRNHRKVDSHGDENEEDRFSRYMTEISKGILHFSETVRSINQKMSLIGTADDSRENHKRLTALVDKGEKISSKIKKRLRDLSRISSCSSMKKSQTKKLSSDYRSQLSHFQEACKEFMLIEKEAVDLIRRTSIATTLENKSKFDLNNYDEDQLYAQVNITHYDMDDLNRREEDIIHITHQLKEVNAAYREIDGLVEDQNEVVVEVTENTDVAKDNIESGLEQIQQADIREGYCNCSKRKCICYGVGVLFLVILVLSLVFASK